MSSAAKLGLLACGLLALLPLALMAAERWAGAVIWRRARKLDLYGYPVGVDATSLEDSALAASGMVAAFDLIGATWPRYLPRMRRYVRRIVVNPAFLAAAQWDARRQQVEVRLSTLTKDYPSAERTAVILVHEFTHARLSAHGLSSHRLGRPRVERMCIRQELAFARALPPSPFAEHVAAGAERDLTSVEEIYSSSHMRATMRESAIESGLPPRLVAFLLRLRSIVRPAA